MLVLWRQFTFNFEQLMIPIDRPIHHSYHLIILLLNLNHLRRWRCLWWPLKLVTEAIIIARSISPLLTSRVMASNSRYKCFTFFSILAFDIRFHLIGIGFQIFIRVFINCLWLFCDWLRLRLMVLLTLTQILNCPGSLRCLEPFHITVLLTSCFEFCTHLLVLNAIRQVVISFFLK